MSLVTASAVLVKQPGERRQYTFDFSNLMATSETIESSPAPAVTQEKMCGDSATLDIETPSISGQTILVWISDGTHGSRYRLECTITTSTGQILEGDGILLVKDK